MDRHRLRAQSCHSASRTGVTADGDRAFGLAGKHHSGDRLRSAADTIHQCRPGGTVERARQWQPERRRRCRCGIRLRPDRQHTGHQDRFGWRAVECGKGRCDACGRKSGRCRAQVRSDSAAPNQSPDNDTQVAARPQESVWPAPPAAAADALPAGEPISGPVPLPRKRPTSFAVAGNVPLPAPRPDIAGGGATDASPTAIDWLKKVFHSSGSPAQPSDSASDTAHE